MVKIKVHLRRKAEEEWFKDIANKMMEEFGEGGVWSPSEEGYVWTHKRHGGKVMFLRQYEDSADFVRIWHPHRRRFKTSQAVADFVQWTCHRARDYVRKIEVPVWR